MDRREAMALSGSSYYMQRGISGTGSGIQGSPGIGSLPNQNISFQSNIGGSSIGSTLPLEPSAAILTHGVNVGGPSTAPPAEPARRKREGLENMGLMGLSHWHCPPDRLLLQQPLPRPRSEGEGDHQGPGGSNSWLPLVSIGGELTYCMTYMH